jgi:HTH-type transcriptional regulator / antitoxin HipB
LNEEAAFYQNLAQMVINTRKQAGLSQLELAEHAGVGKTVVYDIEHGKKTVKLETLYNVLSVLNIKIRFESPL